MENTAFLPMYYLFTNVIMVACFLIYQSSRNSDEQ
jgi:hypothetical protein